MRRCNKRCIANVDGLCAVVTCEGAITTTNSFPRTEDDVQAVERAARRYDMARSMFEYAFGPDYVDEDNEE